MKSSLESLRSRISSGRDAGADAHSTNTKQSGVEDAASIFTAPSLLADNNNNNILSSFHQHAELLRRGDDEDGFDDDDYLEQPMELASLEDGISQLPEPSVASLPVAKAATVTRHYQQQQQQQQTFENRPHMTPTSAPSSITESVSLPRPDNFSLHEGSAQVSNNSSSLSLPDEGSCGSREDNSTLPTILGKYDQGQKAIFLMDPAKLNGREERGEEDVFEDEQEPEPRVFASQNAVPKNGVAQRGSDPKAKSYSSISAKSLAPTARTEAVANQRLPSSSSNRDGSFVPIPPNQRLQQHQQYQHQQQYDDETSTNYSNSQKQTQHSNSADTFNTSDDYGSVRSFYDSSEHPVSMHNNRSKQLQQPVEAVPFQRANNAYAATRSSQISDFHHQNNNNNNNNNSASHHIAEPPIGTNNNNNNNNKGNDSVKKPAKSALRPTRRFGGGPPSVAGTLVDDRSTVGGAERMGSFSQRSGNLSRTAGSGGIVPVRGVPYQYSSSSSLSLAEKKKGGGGARIRALAALLCLIVSLVLATVYGNGTIGLKLTSGWMHNTVMTKGQSNGGLPPPTGGGATTDTRAYNGTQTFPDLKSMHLLLPAAMENFADWTIPFPAGNRTDLPVFWSIPRAGGQVVSNILGQCLGLVEASGAGAGNQQQALQIYDTPKGARYVNVDTTTLEGLLRAERLGLVESGFADVMYTTLIADAAANLFSNDAVIAVVDTTTTNDNYYHGRLFAVFRDPMERSMSVYQQAKTLDPTVQHMSMADYAVERLINNEMVRTLVHKNITADLNQDDLTMAMELLRRKCVVGLVDRMEESMSRFEMYFGWDTRSETDTTVQACQRKFLVPSTERLSAPLPESEAYNALMKQNRLDLQLYDYARYLYDVQGGN